MIKLLNLKKVLMVTLVSTALSSLFFIPPQNYKVVKAMSSHDYSKYVNEKAVKEKKELRGVWICTISNLDWPTAKTMDIIDDNKRIEKTKEELLSILDNAKSLNMNAVFLQISPSADAFYKSNIVPWSRYLTGTFGKDPGFDPLEFAILESHKRNLEFHAWFNPYRVTLDNKDATKKSLNISKSVYKEHPNWIRTAMARFVVDPGIEEVRQWAFDRVKEVVDNYDIDGVHFDDYFYYEKKEGELKDIETFEKYNNNFSNLADWRRNNTYTLIKAISKEIEETKPNIKFGVSPSAVWGNISDGHKQGSNTSSSFTNYNRLFADTKKWVDEEIIDYIAPQVYFSFDNPHVPYEEITSWWANLCKLKDVHLYIGQPLYKIDLDKYFKGKKGLDQLSKQFAFNEKSFDIQGSIIFRYKNFIQEKKQNAVKMIKDDFWDKKSLIPTMSWKNASTPTQPSNGILKKGSTRTRISWIDNNPNTNYFAIYKFNIDEKPFKLELIDTKVKQIDGLQFFSDYTIDTTKKSAYFVTSLNRIHNESNGLVIVENSIIKDTVLGDIIVKNDKDVSPKKSISKYFPDVDESFRFAKDSIDYLYENNIVKGNLKGQFTPGERIKRCDFIIMLVNGLNINSNFKSNFVDVKESNYFYKHVGIAKDLGIINGIGNGNFDPYSNISRQDMIVIIWNALILINFEFEEPPEKFLSKYKDSTSISDYAKTPLTLLSFTGFLEGNDKDNIIRPKINATRAEVAVIIKKIMEVD